MQATTVPAAVVAGGSGALVSWGATALSVAGGEYRLCW